MTNYNDGKWHAWNGGGCPLHPLSEVRVLWLIGEHCAEIRCGLAVNLAWRGNPHGEIIAFRVIKEHKEPREFWITEYPEGEMCIHANKASAEKVGTADRNGQIIHVREVIE